MPTAILLDDAQDTLSNELDLDLHIAELEVSGDKAPSLGELTQGNCWATAECCSVGGSVSTLSPVSMCLLC